MNIQSVLNTIQNTFRQYNPPDRQVYKRIVKRVGGDDLIGRPGSVSYTDTLLDPQPIYQRLGRYIVGRDAASEMMVQDANLKSYAAVAYEIMFAPQSIGVSDLNNPNLLIMFKFATGAIEEYMVTDYETIGAQGNDLLILAYIKSVKRP